MHLDEPHICNLTTVDYSSIWLRTKEDPTKTQNITKHLRNNHQCIKSKIGIKCRVVDLYVGFAIFVMWDHVTYEPVNIAMSPPCRRLQQASWQTRVLDLRPRQGACVRQLDLSISVNLCFHVLLWCHIWLKFL